MAARPRLPISTTCLRFRLVLTRARTRIQVVPGATLPGAKVVSRFGALKHDGSHEGRFAVELHFDPVSVNPHRVSVNSHLVNIKPGPVTVNPRWWP
jgi:hypothetical protein